MSPFSLDDKRRGAIAGLIAGDALGVTGDGLDREQLLTRFGRILEIEVVPGEPRLGATIDFATDAADRPEDQPKAALFHAAIRALDSECNSHQEGDSGVRDACQIISVAVAVAFSCDPFLRLDVRSILEGSRSSVNSKAALTGLEILDQQIRAPRSPTEMSQAFDELPESLAATLLGLQSLFLRHRSFEEAVVYAVNLGGACSLRGGLVGAIEGVHRGAIAIPIRWLSRIELPDNLDLLAGITR